MYYETSCMYVYILSVSYNHTEIQFTYALDLGKVYEMGDIIHL